MPFTAGDVVSEARDQHISFDPQRSPDTVLLRQLNRYTRELYFRAVEKDSSLYTTVATVTFPLADFDAGYTLPAYVYMQGGTLFMTGTNENNEPFNIVPWRNRFMPNMHSAGFIENGTLYFVGDEADWIDVARVELHYVPEPTLPAGLTADVPLPDGAKRACVDHLAWWMARRQGQYEGVLLDLDAWYRDWKASELEFLVEIAQHSRGEATYVREEW